MEVEVISVHPLTPRELSSKINAFLLSQHSLALESSQQILNESWKSERTRHTTTTNSNSDGDGIDNHIHTDVDSSGLSREKLRMNSSVSASRLSDDLVYQLQLLHDHIQSLSQVQISDTDNSKPAKLISRNKQTQSANSSTTPSTMPASSSSSSSTFFAHKRKSSSLSANSASSAASSSSSSNLSPPSGPNVIANRPVSGSSTTSNTSSVTKNKQSKVPKRD